MACPVPWLLAPALAVDSIPRCGLIRCLAAEPTTPLIAPVRDMRVLYGLKTRHYEGSTSTQVPHAHEYFCPMDALTAERGDENPAMRALIARASAAASFMDLLPRGERRVIASSRFTPAPAPRTPLEGADRPGRR